MIVYVAISGCYSQQGVAGVFDSPERAMAAFPKGKWTRELWVRERMESWENGRDWDDAVSIVAYEIQDSGPLYAVDEILLHEWSGNDLRSIPLSSQGADEAARGWT